MINNEIDRKFMQYIFTIVRFFEGKEITIDDSRDRLRKTAYNLKTRPVRENKIEVMRMACNLDVNSDLPIFFVQNIDDEIEIVVEKKVNQSEKEWGKCLKEMSVFTIREIENHRIRSRKSSSAIMKATDRGKSFKEERYLSTDDVFVANTERIFMLKEIVNHQ